MVSCSLISREEDADSEPSLLHSPLYSPPAAVRSDALDADPPLLVTPLTTFGGINASCDDAHPCKNLLSCVQGTCANVLVNATCDPSVPNVCGSYGLECINISVSSGIHSTFSSSSSSSSSFSSSSSSFSSSSSPSIQPGFHCILPHQLAGMVCYPAYGDQQCASGYCDAKGVCESISKLHGPCAVSQGQCTPGLYCAPSPSVGDPLLGQCAPSIAVGQSCASALPLPAPNHVCVSGSSCVADGNAGATCVRYYASTVGQPCALDSPYTSCRYGLRCLSNSTSSSSSLNNDNNQNINVPRVGYCAKFPSSNPTSCVDDDECMMGFRCVDGALLSGGGGAANGTRRCAAVLNAGCQPELDILTQCLAQFDCPFEPEAMLGTTQLLGPALPGSCTAQNCQLQHTKAVCCQTKPRFQALPYSPAFYLRGMCYPAPTFPWYGTVFISLGFSLLVAAAVVLTLVCLKRRRLSREASSSSSSASAFASASSSSSSAQHPLLTVSPDSGDDDDGGGGDEERGYARLGRASHSSYSDASSLALPSQPSARLLSIGTLGGEAIALSRQAEDASSVSTSFLRSDRFLLSPDHSESEDDDDEYNEYKQYNNEYNAQPRLSHPDMRTPHHAAQPRLSHPFLARTHLSPSPISPSATPSSSLGQDAVVSPTLSTSPPSFSSPSFSSPSSALPAYPAYSYSHHSSQTASLPASLTIAMSPVGIAPLPALSGNPPAHDLTPIDHPSFSDDEDDNDDSNEDQRLL